MHLAAGWCLGPLMQEEVRHIWRRISPPKFAANAALNGRHAGERRCFVIGNGPSLKNMDLRPLAQEFTIAANSFYKHPHAAQIELDYLCINDPHFMQDEPRTIAWHNTIAAELPTARLMLNEAALALVQARGLYSGRDIHYVTLGHWTYRADLINLDFRKSLNIGMTTGSSIAIPLALSLGFREIYLVGFDCNWMTDTAASYHFYQTHEFFPEFDSVEKDNRGLSYEDELRSNLREFESHRLLRQRAEAMNVRIINATAGGMLDVYERRAFADCLS